MSEPPQRSGLPGQPSPGAASMPGASLDHWLARWLSPTSQDEETWRRARLLLAIQACLLCGIALAAVFLFLDGQVTATLILLGTGLLILLSIGMLRFGWLTQATWVVIMTMVSGVQFLVFVGNGVHDIAMLIYPLIIIIASLLLASRGFILVVSLIVLSVAWTVHAEVQGFLRTPYSAITNYTDLFQMTLILSISGLAVYLLADNLLKNLRNLRQSQAALAQSLHRERQLYSLSRAITSTLELEKILKDVVELGCGLVEAEAGSLSLVSEDEQEIIDLYDFNIPAPVAGVALQPGQGLTWRLILTRESILVDDYLAYPEALPELASAGYARFVGAPILVGERCLGAISFIRKAVQPPFTPADLALVESLARQGGAAIRNARLYRAVLQRDAILDAATFAAERFLSTPDWRQSIDRVLANLGEQVQASHAFFFENRRDPDGELYSFLAYEWTAPGFVPDLGTPLYQRLSHDRLKSQGWAQILGSGQPFYGRRAALPPEEQAQVDPHILSFLQLPVFVGGVWWGIIGLDDCRVERRWTNAEVDALWMTAGLLSAVVQRQQAEEALRELNADLEERVRQRTLALEMAKIEMEAFAYSVSHDLRAPLRSIDGYSKLMLEDYAPWLDDQAQEYLHNVRQATQQMGHLIDDLLKLSRVTRQEMRLELVDLSLLSHEVANNLQQNESGRLVEIKIQPGMLVRGDPSLLRILLNNLLGNAWKFTAKARLAQVTVGMQRLDGERVFYVRDNGIGFDMKYRERLFRPFERLHESEYDGTGIGLATVQRVVQRHGGRIWAESEPGQGAAFFWTLAEYNGV